MCLGMKLVEVFLLLLLYKQSTKPDHSLAWAELRLSFAYIFRRFDMTLDQSRCVVRANIWYQARIGALLTLYSPDELLWREGFVPKFLGNHVKANMTMLTS